MSKNENEELGSGTNRWRHAIRGLQLGAIAITLCAVAWTSAQAIASGPLDDMGRELRTVAHKRAPPKKGTDKQRTNTANRKRDKPENRQMREEHRSDSAKLEPLNVNTATASELVRLPGIGPAKAKRIVEFRLRRGRFKRVRDIRRVKGIGRKTLHRLAPYLTVKGETTM